MTNKKSKEKPLEKLSKAELIKEVRRLKRRVASLETGKSLNSGKHENGQDFHIGGW